MLAFVILFVLSFVLFPSEGQITSPPDGSNMTVLPGDNVNITWSFNDDVSQLLFRAWYFTSSDGSFVDEPVASIFRDGQPQIDSSGLSGVSIVKPATLLLKNVNQTYNGTYRFDLAGLGGSGSSQVVVIIAKTPIATVNCSSSTTLIEGDNFACECKGTHGNPPADVTWYKNNTQIVTGKEEAIFVLNNVDKDDSGTYRCQAKSHEKANNETSIELIVILTPIISVNCSSVTTVIRSDYFACECKGTDGNPPADVTWFKDNTQNVTGKEKAILSFPNVKKDDSGTYRCEAKSHDRAKNETSIELIVNYPPENARLMLTRSGQSASITCTAEARPEPTFQIFFNCEKLVQTDPTYTIPEVNRSHVGIYKCVAENILGNSSSDSELFLDPDLFSAAPPPATTFPPNTSKTSTNSKATDSTTSGTEWYIIVVTLVSGFIAGILFSYIASCSHRRWFRNKKPKRNPDQQPTEADSTYQELDLSKMNKEDNYQSLRGNVARINDVTNDDDSNYTELSKTRDVENNYQSLT